MFMQNLPIDRSKWLYTNVYVQMCMLMYTDMIEIDFPE